MLFCLLANLVAAQEKRKIQERYEHKFSLMRPYVEDNGKSFNYKYSGDYLVTMRTKNDSVQLGFQAPNSVGFLQSKEELKKKNARFEFEFTMSAKEGEPSYGFWLSSELSEGSFYGRNADFKGIGVIVDLKDSPKVFLTDPSGKIRSPVYPTFQSGLRNKIVIECLKESILVKLITGHTKEMVVGEEKRGLDVPYYIGISCSTGKSSSPLEVKNIYCYSLTKIREKYVKGERPGRNWLTLSIGLACIAGLAYYLYQKQIKDEALKN